jgi:hypothetical protein
MSAFLSTRIRFRVALWLDARLLPLRISRNATLDEVLALARPPHGIRFHGLPVAYILKRVLKTTRRPLLMRDQGCLRQGILAYRFMTSAGYKSELHFGVDRTTLAGSLKAHCWLVHEGRIVLNPPTPEMVPIFVHGADTANSERPSAMPAVLRKS